MSTADKLVASSNKAEIDCKAPRKGRNTQKY